MSEKKQDLILNHLMLIHAKLDELLAQSVGQTDEREEPSLLKAEMEERIEERKRWHESQLGGVLLSLELGRAVDQSALEVTSYGERKIARDEVRKSKKKR
jgi:hypothetical protein